MAGVVEILDRSRRERKQIFNYKLSWRGGWRVRKCDSVQCFPIVCWDHLDRVPGTAVEKGAVGTFAGALLTADAEVRIYFDTSKRWMVLVRHPEHTGLDRTILDTRRRSGATRAAIRGDGKYARPLLARGLSVALRHRPMFLYDVEYPFFSLTFTVVESCFDSNIALRKSSTICVDDCKSLLPECH